VDAVLSVFPSEESGDGSMGFALFFSELDRIGLVFGDRNTHIYFFLVMGMLWVGILALACSMG
jgi:hypothetical protein